MVWEGCYTIFIQGGILYSKYKAFGGVLLRSDLRKARLLMGRAIIKSYKEDWLPNKQALEDIESAQGGG